MLIKFHRGMSRTFAGGSYKRTAIIVDSEGPEVVAELEQLNSQKAKFDLDISYVDVIVTERVADTAVIEALTSFGIANEGDRKTTPAFKFAVFNPRILTVVQSRARLLQQKLKRQTLLSVEDKLYGCIDCSVEVPVVSYVGPRDYIAAHLNSGYDTIIVVGDNTDVLSLTNILKRYDYVGAEMWT